MPDLKAEDFAEGQDYEVGHGDGALTLTLARVETLPHAVRDAGGFRLEFRGPLEPLLPQATHAFRRGDATHEIFVVPVGRDADGHLYEAIFN